MIKLPLLKLPIFNYIKPKQNLKKENNFTNLPIIKNNSYKSLYFTKFRGLINAKITFKNKNYTFDTYFVSIHQNHIMIYSKDRKLLYKGKWKRKIKGGGYYKVKEIFINNKSIDINKYYINCPYKLEIYDIINQV